MSQVSKLLFNGFGPGKQPIDLQPDLDSGSEMTLNHLEKSQMLRPFIQFLRFFFAIPPLPNAWLFNPRHLNSNPKNHQRKHHVNRYDLFGTKKETNNLSKWLREIS